MDCHCSRSYPLIGSSGGFFAHGDFPHGSLRESAIRFRRSFCFGRRAFL